MIHDAAVSEIEAAINAKANKRAFGLRRGEQIDMSGFYSREGNVALASAAGVMLFPKIEEGVFDSHFAFLPTTSTADVMASARAMLIEMFTKRGAHVIKGYPPRVNRAVRAVGTALGYRRIPDTTTRDGLGRECLAYEVRREWVTSSEGLQVA